MESGLQRLAFAVPEGQRYSCLQCGNSCRWWRIEVEPAERDRIAARDWATESPRLNGVRLFEEQRIPGRSDPVIQTAQIDGQCVFLEGDNLCLIHKVLGLEAKPLVCQAFPVMLIRTEEGTLVAGNYACSALARNEGEPFTEQEGFARALLNKSLSASAEGRPEAISLVPPKPLLAGGTRMAWPAYLALEGALLEILGRPEPPVAQRLVAARSLAVSASARWAGKAEVEAEEASGWLAESRADGFARAFARAASAPKAPPMRQRAVLAPLIADVETAALRASGRASTALGYAVGIVNGAGQVGIPTLRGRVDLAAMRRVAFDQDSPRFDDYLSRFLRNFVLRKSLLESPSLREGCNYLALYFALARWYAVASAALRGRAEVEEEDVVEGIKVVEKAYVHRMGLRSGLRKGLLSTLLKLEMDLLVSPAALVRSHQPVPARGILERYPGG